MFRIKNIQKYIVLLLIAILSVNATGQNQESSVTDKNVKKEKRKKQKKVKLPNIDLSHWKITIPEADENGKVISVEPPEIFNYASNEVLKPYMYNDSTRGALVFYAFPSNATTANTKYSRSELREQMVPGDDDTNWTFADGANMKGKLQMEEVSKDDDGKYHRVIIMQIHGRLTNQQRNLIGQKDNNAPPILKIYWDNGKIRVKTKELKNLSASEEEILHEDAWDNDDGFNFEQKVGFKKFTLEVQVSAGKMVIILNNTEYKVYENIHMKRWSVFENYFKAGNYFQSRDKGSFARIRYYNLEVRH